MPEQLRRRTRIELPWRTILKIISAVALVWLCIELIQLILVVIVAVLLAVTLDPVVVWLEHRGLSRWAASTVVCLILLVAIGAFFWMTWAQLSDQAQYVAQHFSEIERQIVGKVPGWMRQRINETSGGDVTSYVAPYALRVARSIGSAIVVAILGFILTLYMLIEGQRTRDWLVAYVPKRHRAKTEQTFAEGEKVIFGYVAGNVATSIFATVFVLVSLSILKVPAALLLALVAGVLDFVPVLGFIVAVVPALAIAATVSAKTVLIVALLYVMYHTIENYVIAPRVYGDRLKLSNLAVILAFAIGAEVAGVIGALIALPLAAVYPAVERIWLRDKLATDTVAEHRAIEHRRAG
jgi:predicted PurR-regulated permease PerM